MPTNLTTGSTSFDFPTTIALRHRQRQRLIRPATACLAAIPSPSSRLLVYLALACVPWSPRAQFLSLWFCTTCALFVPVGIGH